MIGLLRKFDDWLTLHALPKEPEPKPSAANRKMDRYKADEERRAAVLATAENEREARRAKFEAEAEAQAAAFRFSCQMAGGMLILKVGNESYAVNSAHLVKVSLEPGAPVEDTALLSWTERSHSYYDWRHLRSWPVYGHYENYERQKRFPAPSRPASIKFAGADLSITVPHARSEEIYAQVIDALAAATTPA